MNIANFCVNTFIVVFYFVIFFFYVFGVHGDLHRVDRRQRQMCIRDRHMISMAVDLNFRVICEGVETAQDVEFLRAVGCDMAQGCLLYTSDAADALLCVVLGGRRNIKKKKNINISEPTRFTKINSHQ